MSRTVAVRSPASFYERFERKAGDPLTTHYCPGCGHGLVHKYVAEAIDNLGIQDRTIMINSVGCSVFAYYYFDVAHVQVPHGRCPAAATAVKRALPDSVVIGYQGDGDLAAIGGNEILHAANRGENLTIVFVNNAIYGMTGGQMAPTTPLDMRTTTTPFGRQAHNDGFPLKVCELLATLDAPCYLERVAVGDSRHNARARRAIRKAIQNQVDNRGFSLVEILSPCPVGWKLSPTEAAERAVEIMPAVFPLGVFRDGSNADLGHPRRRTVVAHDALPSVLDLEREASVPALPDHGRAIEEARFKIAGFGGQGVLALGLALAHAGMLARRHVSWMPSYGPEMRGGTANCGVTIADREIGTPLIEHPSLLVAMNQPSLDRFAGDVVPGGVVCWNGSLIERPPAREDVRSVRVPANEIAERLGNPKAANMVLLGAVLGVDETVSREAVIAGLPRVLKSDGELLRLNRGAIDAGYESVRAGSASVR